MSAPRRASPRLPQISRIKGKLAVYARQPPVSDVGEMVTSGGRAGGGAPFQHRCSVLLACALWAPPLTVIDRTSARPAGNLRITTIFRRACKGDYGRQGGYGRNWEAIAAPGPECRGTAAYIRQ